MSTTTDRKDPDLHVVEESGQNKKYLVLSEEERAKGFVRPYRDTYKHLYCGTTTKMGRAISETYARDPSFYNGTYCCHCGTHFRLRDEEDEPQFVWVPDGEAVGD